MSASTVLSFIKENDVRFVDLRFTDTKGKEQHVTIPVSQVNEDFFEDGKMFDGSSIAGWKGINDSDMILMPQADIMLLDPFSKKLQSISAVTLSNQALCKVTSVAHVQSLNVLKST